MKKRNLFLTLLSLSTSLMFAQNKTVNTETSEIHWLGKKVTGEHMGTIKLSEGNLNFDNGQLKGGDFVVNMNSLVCTDLSGTYKDKLEGHLKSDDFFGVEAHPTATMTITKVTPTEANKYLVSGDFNIKGITQNIDFEMTIENNLAKAKVVIDRAKHNIRYGSGSFFENLGDKTIYDDFELKVQLSF